MSAFYTWDRHNDEIKPGTLGLSERTNSPEEFEKFRVVGKDKFGNFEISTVFLAIDHGFGIGHAPVLFETIVFGPPSEKGEPYQQRYETPAEARCGHAWLKSILELCHGKLSDAELDALLRLL